MYLRVKVDDKPGRQLITTIVMTSIIVRIEMCSRLAPLFRPKRTARRMLIIMVSPARL
jgi:hypothetical protein